MSHAPQVKGLQLLVVVSALASLKDHRAEHEQGDNEDDEPLPDHSDYLVGGHEALEFLDPVLDKNNFAVSDASVLEVFDLLAAFINLCHRLDSDLKVDLGPLLGDPRVRLLSRDSLRCRRQV